MLLDYECNFALDADLVALLLVLGNEFPKVVEIARNNLQERHFLTTSGRAFYRQYMQIAEENQPPDLLCLIRALHICAHKNFLKMVVERESEFSKASKSWVNFFAGKVEEILERYWREGMRDLKYEIYEVTHTDEEITKLVEDLKMLEKQRPSIKMPRQ